MQPNSDRIAYSFIAAEKTRDFNEIKSSRRNEYLAALLPVRCYLRLTFIADERFTRGSADG